jgi:hypothetical protein
LRIPKRLFRFQPNQAVPVGAAYVCFGAAAARKPRRSARSCCPVLLIVTLFPPITMFLPTLFMGK